MKEVRHYCRACKSITVENFSDMESEYLGTSYKILFFDCTGIFIENDDFSRILCQTCLRALIFSHEFTQMCKKTQKELECSLPLSMLRRDETELLESMVRPLMDDMSLKEMEEEEKELESNKKNDQESKVTVIERPKKYKSKEVRRCDMCNEDLDSLPMIRKHMKEIHKEHVCNKCKILFHGSLSFKSHFHSCQQKKKPTPTTTCKFCEKTFSTISVLNRHIRTVHEKIREYSCDLCDKSFQHKSHLLAHQSVHSEKVRAFRCEICSLSFKTEPVLANHLKLHTTIPNHICDICGSKFKSTTYLKIHKDSHVTTRTISCDSCGKSFKTIKNLKDHAWTHKESEPVDCHVCGKKLKNKLTLKNHLRDHFTPGVACPACGKTFTNKHVLKDHIAAQHENVRNYVCRFEGCDHAYFTSSHLNYHVKAVHLGVQVRKSKS